MENVLVTYVAEIIFFLFKIGEAMLEPSMRLLIYQAVCDIGLHHSNETATCSDVNLQESEDPENDLQIHAARYILFYKMLLNMPALFLCLFCGAWSDRIGRKMPIMLASFGTIVAVLLYMVAALTRETSTFFPLIFVGASVRGAFGKSAIITMAVHSYVTDMTGKEERTNKLGHLLAVNFFGFFTGSLLIGVLLDVASFDVVLCLVMFVYSLCIVVTMLFMKENAPGVTSFIPKTSEVEQPPSEMLPLSKAKHPFTLRNIKDSLSVILQPRANGARFHLLVLFAIIIIQQACKSGEVDVTVLFVVRQPLGWRGGLYGYFLATDYVCLGAAVLVLLPILINLADLDDASLVVIGIVFKVVRLLLLSLATRTWMVFLSVVLGCPSALIICGAKSLISKTVEGDEVGKAFSLLSCGETAANFVGSIIFLNLYAETLQLFAGFTFTVDAGFFIILLIGVVLLMKDLSAGLKRRELNDLLTDDVKSDYGTTMPTTMKDDDVNDEKASVTSPPSKELLLQNN